MSEYRICREQLAVYEAHLRREERSPGTIENYLRHVRVFAVWLSGRPVTRETAAAWKNALQESGYAPATINSMLTAVNQFFRFAGWDPCRVRLLKIQRRLFREDSRELTRAEYDRLLAIAKAQGQERLALVMETICATGIRVSEVRYITVDAARRGRAEIALKGKIRVILLPGKLCRKLLQYARKNQTASGEIFLTRSGKSLSRKQI